LTAQLHRAALSLGSNQQPEKFLRLAVADLRARFPGIRMSSGYRFPAMGFDGPDFVNAAAVIETTLDPLALNAWLHELEDHYGRDRGGPRYGNRSLDIDIVLFDDLMLDGLGTLQIPRAELRHAFVLKPLAEIAPQWREPQSGNSMLQLWTAHAQYAEVFERVEWMA